MSARVQRRSKVRSSVKYKTHKLPRRRYPRSDSVNHPTHYNAGKFEVIDVLEDWGLDQDFCLGNCVKYVARARHKGAELEDLKKARWYLDRRIKRLEKAQ